MRQFAQSYDLQDALESIFVHRKLRGGGWGWFIFGGFIALIFLGGMFQRRSWDQIDVATAVSGSLIALAVGGVVVLVGRYAEHELIRHQVKEHWKQTGLEGKETVYRFDGTTLEIEDDLAGGKLAWADLYQWHEGEKYLFLYRSDEFFYFINKPLLDEEILADLRAALANSPAKRIAK